MKNIHLFILITFLISCDKPSVNDKNKRNENWCWFIVEETGEGMWIPVGTDNNLPDGTYFLFYCNGKISQKGKIKDNNDIDTIYYYDLTENLIKTEILLPDSGFKEIWLDGKHTLYYNNCNIESEVEFFNNIQLGERIGYYKNGNTKYKTIPSGDTVFTKNYFESGTILDSFCLVNGMPEGQSKTFYENGNIKTIQPYKNGKKDGLCIWYYENGQIDTKCYFKDGIENGYCIAYYENAIVKSEGNFENGKQEGLIINYFENGQIDSKINQKEGKNNGKLWFYYKNGKLMMFAEAQMDVTTHYKSYNETGKLVEEYSNSKTIKYD